MEPGEFNIPRFLAVLPLFSDLSPAELSRRPIEVRSNRAMPTALSNPFRRAVSAAGVMCSWAAAATSEPASAIASVTRSFEDPATTEAVNVGGTANVLAAARETLAF